MTLTQRRLPKKSSWKTVKPSFTEQTLKDEKLVLIENDTSFSEENEIFFPEQLKFADVKLVFKKNPRTDTENYRPVNTLMSIND